MDTRQWHAGIRVHHSNMHNMHENRMTPAFHRPAVAYVYRMIVLKEASVTHSGFRCRVYFQSHMPFAK
jgi:hypothetical protein